mgnify:CR=1 FL=1
MFEHAAAPHYFSPEHEAYRMALRQFVAKEITPHVHAWEEAEAIPTSLHTKAAQMGVMALGYPEAHGGVPGDVFHQIILAEEMSRCGAGGVVAALLSHSIGLPPLVAHASSALQSKVIPPVLRGEKISALAVTEPSGGSDVAALQCKAVREGDHYVVTGEKIFITSGMRADFFTVAVRTDPLQKGAGGISALLIEGHSPGLTRTKLDKMGWWSSDTAHLRFDGVRVPVEHLIGQENQGFKVFMNNFNAERLGMSAQACMFAQVCLQEATDWARERHTFGQALSQRQVIRHKLVDMAMKIEAARSLVYELAWQVEHQVGDPAHLVARTCMAKILSTQAMQFCADQAVQILGGMGFMRGTRSERIYREVKVMMIGGGSEEIMKDLAARQLGI